MRLLLLRPSVAYCTMYEVIRKTVFLTARIKT